MFDHIFNMNRSLYFAIFMSTVSFCSIAKEEHARNQKVEHISNTASNEQEKLAEVIRSIYWAVGIAAAFKVLSEAIETQGIPVTPASIILIIEFLLHPIIVPQHD